VRLRSTHHQTDATLRLNGSGGGIIERREHARQFSTQMDNWHASLSKDHLGETLVAVATAKTKECFETYMAQRQPEVRADMAIKKTDALKAFEDERAVHTECQNAGIPCSFPWDRSRTRKRSRMLAGRDRRYCRGSPCRGRNRVPGL
jgi:hypothetical protein